MTEFIETIINPVIIAAIVSVIVSILIELNKKRLEIKNIQKELIESWVDVREKYLKLGRNYDIIEYIKDHEWEHREPKDIREYINFESMDKDFFNLQISYIRCFSYIACAIKLTKEKFKPLLDVETYLNELRGKQIELRVLKEIKFENITPIFGLLVKIREKMDEIPSLIAFSKFKI